MDIKKCPGLFIGKPSLQRLYAYIGGFVHSESIHDSYSEYLDGFQEYISEYYALNTDHNWANIIEFFNPIEEEAFDKFYELLDKFYEGIEKNEN